MEQQLSDRSRLVLKLVIEEYVSTARAVGSEVLREKFKLPYSSATLRNEMAELERRGLLTHLHTSGGRVPSEAGYRLFVENLMDNLALNPADIRRVEHQFHQVEGVPDVGRWAELAASVLAQLARNAALVTTPRSDDVRLKQLQLMHLTDRSALLVAVMSDGRVRQSVCTLPYEPTQEELATVTAVLNSAFEGLVPLQMFERVRELEGPAADIAPQVVGALTDVGQAAAVSQSGLRSMLDQPEFRRDERALRVAELLEGGALVTRLADRVGGSPGVHVMIGSENPIEEMSGCSVVAATYQGQHGSYGLLTVVGPTRMQYQRTISSVYYLSRLLSHMLQAKN